MMPKVAISCDERYPHFDTHIDHNAGDDPIVTMPQGDYDAWIKIRDSYNAWQDHLRQLRYRAVGD